MTVLDELEEIKELVNNDKHFKYKNIVNFNCESIEKSLKAFEIIKEKRVDCKSLVECSCAEEYNDIWFDTSITEEEFNLLKECLEDEKISNER